jgi:hypothetical protein
MKFYSKDDVIVVSIRGTEKTDIKDLSADASIAFNNLDSSDRYKKDYQAMVDFYYKYKTVPLYYYGVGYSLGGAIMDRLISEGYIKKGVSFNPAIEPSNIVNDSYLKNRRIYIKTDPLYLVMGQFAKGSETVSGKSDRFSHSLSNFDDIVGGVRYPFFSSKVPKHERLGQDETTQGAILVPIEPDYEAYPEPCYMFPVMIGPEPSAPPYYAEPDIHIGAPNIRDIERRVHENAANRVRQREDFEVESESESEPEQEDPERVTRTEEEKRYSESKAMTPTDPQGGGHWFSRPIQVHPEPIHEEANVYELPIQSHPVRPPPRRNHNRGRNPELRRRQYERYMNTHMPGLAETSQDEGGKKRRHIRKYLKGMGIPATKKNMDKALSACEAEGVVF